MYVMLSIEAVDDAHSAPLSPFSRLVAASMAHLKPSNSSGFWISGDSSPLRPDGKTVRVPTGMVKPSTKTNGLLCTKRLQLTED